MYKFEAQVAKILRAEIGDLVPIQPKFRAAPGLTIVVDDAEATTSSLDGTVKLSRVPELQPLAALLFDAVDEEWLAVAPDGSYGVSAKCMFDIVDRLQQQNQKSQVLHLVSLWNRKPILSLPRLYRSCTELPEHTVVSFPAFFCRLYL